MSSESWKARADDLAVRRQRLLHLGAGAAEAGAVAGRGGDQRAGLAGDHVEVVLQRVLAGPGGDGLEDLALDQAGEGLGLDPHGLRTQPGGQLGGLGEEEVAGEDRDEVVPASVGRVRPAPQVGLVHHVVVVERAEVGDLHDAGGGRGPPRRPGRGPVSAARSTSSGRSRLPPAASRWEAAWVT